CLAALDTVVLLAIHFKAGEPRMVAILAPQVPLAYLVARFAVARARRGEVPDWRGVFGRLASNAVRTRRRDHFPSPARAQAWFEWRRHGLSLPALVGLLLPFELALLWLAKDAPAFVFEILFLALITPPFMAAFTAWTVSQPNPQVRDSYGVPPFIATRPLTSAELIAAKLKMAMWSTLAAWLLVLVAMPLALEWSGTWSVVTERARRMNDAIATRLDRSRLLGDRALVAGAACWVLAVLALYGVLVWFFSTPFVARYVLALIAILAVPLARISAAPLALAWNRHR